MPLFLGRVDTVFCAAHSCANFLLTLSSLGVDFPAVGHLLGVELAAVGPLLGFNSQSLALYPGVEFPAVGPLFGVELPAVGPLLGLS